MALLSVRELSVEFATRDGVVCAVNGVSFSLEAGQVPFAASADEAYASAC